MASIPESWRKGRAKAEVIPAGTPFGHLTVLSGLFRKPPPVPAVYFYRCGCSCGQECDVRRSNLVSGNTTSCGCHRRAQRTSHGESGCRLHNIWTMMKQRCYNPNYNQFADYGGRGITVCDEWRDNYEAFRDWSLANGYADKLEIDRERNDAAYRPDNCRWVTRAIQSRNKRSNQFCTAFGETKCLTDWARDPRCKVTRPTLVLRVNAGWKAEDAIATPPTPRNRRRHGIAPR